ncbi:hypothetical protein [Polaribacter cellanae]|uniref:Uncharacterized protein n=1 Tax=Polaribacter cellanae TaxID=2818493 RepID=A0A975CLX8_9FLAO|nr:hypothetical protein [Polaribacter cellanae]QTE21024.1 hypothetical protein J3359_09185 [Polaribacter cellanae]
MKLLIIDKNGFREFIEANPNPQDKTDSKSIIELLKESINQDKKEPVTKELELHTFTSLLKLLTTRPSLYSWIERGDLIPVKIGGRVFLDTKTS